MQFPNLKEFVSYILHHRLDDFVQLQNEKITKADLPILKYFSNLSPAEFFSFSRQSAQAFLVSISEDNAIARLKVQNQTWKNGQGEIAKQEVLLTDMVTGNLLRKETFIDFLDIYTNDLSLYKSIIKEIEQFYAEVLEISLGGFFEVQREQIYKEKELNETILNSSEDAIFSYDTDTRVVVWNNVMEGRTGVLKKNIIGQKVFDAFPAFKKSRAALSIHQALLGKTEKLEGEPFESQNGYYNSICTPLYDHQKKIIGGVYILRDVTQDKHKEQLLRDVNKNLIDSNEELEKAQQKLQGFNVHLEQKVKLRNHELESINEANKIIAGNLNLQDIVVKITAITTNLCNAEFGVFFHLAHDLHPEGLPPYTFSGITKQRFEQSIEPAFNIILHSILKDNKTVRINDLDTGKAIGSESYTRVSPHFYKSLMGVPVISREGMILGVLCFGHTAAMAFTEESENLVSAITAQTAIAIDNAKLFESVKRSEEKFRFMSEVIPQIVWTADHMGVVDYFNHNWSNYTGKTLQESLKDETGSVVHADDRDKLNRVWQISIEKKIPFDVEYRLRRAKDGEYRWHLGRAQAMINEQGEVVKWFGTITDIHDQKVAQENLLMQSRVLESMSEGVTVTNSSGYIIYTNPAANRMFGYLPAELVGQHLSTQVANPENERQQLVQNLIEQLQQNGSWQGELLNISKDRKLFTTFSYISTLNIENTTLFVCVQRDVTEELKAQIEIKENNLELKNKNRELHRINNDLDNFVYTASHDLKAPVSNIEGLIHALESSLQQTNRLNPEIAGILEMVNASVQRFQVTIKDLTEISKTQKGLYEEATLVNVRHVLEEVMLSISNLIYENQANITINIDPLLDINFSVVNLKSIFYNLLSNALKYKDPSRVADIKIDARTSDSQFLLHVADNGLGIKVEYHDKVFQMFKRAHTHVDGSGVGLYIVKRIIDNAGGSVDIESEIGKGTTFRITIPMKDNLEVNTQKNQKKSFMHNKPK